MCQKNLKDSKNKQTKKNPNLQLKSLYGEENLQCLLASKKIVMLKLEMQAPCSLTTQLSSKKEQKPPT
jgi:hypothetical protein